jgi:hypothetical protein
VRLNPCVPQKLHKKLLILILGIYVRLAGLQPGDRADSKDLFEYSQDLLYTEIDRPLLAHLLPFCLHAWREDLHGSSDFGGFVEHLCPILANRHIFDLHLKSHQTEAVSLFHAEFDNRRNR